MELAKLMSRPACRRVSSCRQRRQGSVDAILDDPISAPSALSALAIAQYIYERAAATGKRAQCFVGAKNHAIVMPDADMDQTVDALIAPATARPRTLACDLGGGAGRQDHRGSFDGKAHSARRVLEDGPRSIRQRITVRWLPGRARRVKHYGRKIGIQEGAKLAVVAETSDAGL